jgi:hypothetical protein
VTQIAIVGCGPAGLLAAHAVMRAGHEPVVYSNTKTPSPVTGGVYLHEGVPGLTNGRPDGLIKCTKVGDEAVYATKVYGSAEAATSWQRLAKGNHPAWALRPVYEALWGLYGAAVYQLAVGPQEAKDLAAAYPLVLNSAPLHKLCQDVSHTFPERPVWYVDKAPGIVQDQQMVYNGRWSDQWFRASRVFDVAVTEYAERVEGARQGRKVMPTTCTCHQRIVRIGRWGTWMPGVLLHHAYRKATDAVHEL